MKNKLKPEEQALFRHAMRDVKPLNQARAKVRPEPPTNVGATGGRPLPMRNVKPTKVKVRPEPPTNVGATGGRPFPMRNVKPTKVKVRLEPPTVKLKKRPSFPDPLPAAPFSDHDYLDLADSEDRLEFARSGISAKLQRALRRGEEAPQAVLDLHGKTVEEARLSLHQFLLACQAEGSTQVLIIHGKGRGHAKPILKNKLNHWLRQSEQVLAFCSARPKDGGTGALYLRLRRG